jgi:hypothetical protein
MTQEERERIHRSDLEKINAVADDLNAEAMDLLACQVDIFEDPLPDHALLEELVRVPISNGGIEK